jgi:hypothetical protein
MAWRGGRSTTPTMRALRLVQRVGRCIVAGVPNLFVLRCGIARMVEIKAPAGDLSDPQRAVLAAVPGGRWPSRRGPQCPRNAGWWAYCGHGV